MQEENVKKTRQPRSSTKAASPETTTVFVETADTPESHDTSTDARKIVVKEIDLNQLIPVRNGYQGKLVYKSARTGEKFVWPEFGSEQMIELRELRNAKNTWKKYFQNNWFMFDDEFSWVIDYLGMKQYYKNALSIDNFDDLFQKTPSEITASIEKLSTGQKNSLIYRSRQLIASGDIDSNKAIAALEKALGVELVDR